MTLYDKLYQAWKRENENTEIQTLPRELYANLANYVKKVREESRMLDEKTTKAKLRQLELRNVTKMIHELVQLRYEKAMQRTMNGKTIFQEGLTKEEGKLAEEFSLLTESYQALSQRILRGTLSHVKREEKPRKMLVLFLQDTPAIIGSDMKTYGPFKPENTATLPSENARILIKQGVAVEVEV